ncbi:hypothetical protein SAMN05216428_11538 [Nitrosospira sp. Nsp11]|nr:hypothetical protein SAMN05216428_11538 [Nitrosospira sp. Nsp11]
MRPTYILITGIVALGFLGCGKSPSDSEIDACVERGVAYFKEIGSYPTLSSAPNTGRQAEDVAFERCNRTITAF